MEEKQDPREKKQWDAAAWDMLYLIQCGINSIVPDPERVAKMDLEKVYARSKSQSLELLTYMALESLIKTNPQTFTLDSNHVLLKWKEKKQSPCKKFDDGCHARAVVCISGGTWNLAYGIKRSYLVPYVSQIWNASDDG